MSFYYLVDGDSQNFTSIPRENIPESLKISDIKRGEIQFVSKDPLTIQVKDDVAINNPDCFVTPIPLFSNNLKNILDSIGVDYVYYKPVYIENKFLESKELYWLAMVPFVECTDPDDEDIIADRIGRFKIFKLVRPGGNPGNSTIFINEELKKRLEKELKTDNLQGFYFNDIKNL